MSNPIAKSLVTSVIAAPVPFAPPDAAAAVITGGIGLGAARDCSIRSSQESDNRSACTIGCAGELVAGHIQVGTCVSCYKLVTPYD